MQNFGVTNKEYYGMLWYFLEWSIVKLCLDSCIKLGVKFEKEFILLTLVMKIAGRLHLSD